MGIVYLYEDFSALDEGIFLGADLLAQIFTEQQALIFIISARPGMGSLITPKAAAVVNFYV